MINKEVRSRFSGLTRIVFSTLLLTLALGAGACSSSSGSGTAGSGVTGSAQ